MSDGKLTREDFIRMTHIVRCDAEAAGRGYVLPDNGWTRYLFPEKSVRGVYAGIQGSNTYLVKQHLEAGKRVSAMAVVLSGWKECVKHVKEVYSKTLWCGQITFVNMTDRGALARVFYVYNGPEGIANEIRYRKKDGYSPEVPEVSGFYPLYQHCKERGGL